MALWGPWTEGFRVFYLIYLLAAGIAVAALAALVSVAWWALLAVLVVLAVRKLRQDQAVRKYEEDLREGRVQRPVRVKRCQECSGLMMPCDACVERHQAAYPA